MAAYYSIYLRLDSYRTTVAASKLIRDRALVQLCDAISKRSARYWIDICLERSLDSERAVEISEDMLNIAERFLGLIDQEDAS